MIDRAKMKPFLKLESLRAQATGLKTMMMQIPKTQSGVLNLFECQASFVDWRLLAVKLIEDIAN